MKQILTVILRNQFNLFYRFGYTYVPKAYCIEIEDLLSDKTRDSLVELFDKITPFEYDEEYVILHIECLIETEKEVYLFSIQDIVSIYPLSQQAKISIESKIDQRIRLEKPIFENMVQEIECKIDNKEREKAIKSIWKICKIDCDWKIYLYNIGLDSINKGLMHRRNGVSANKVKNGNFWEYLIAYDYHQSFPQGTIRYFYQLGEIFSYFKGKEDGVEGTKIEELLKQIKNESNLDEILSKFNSNTLPESFNKEMAFLSGKFNVILASVLFLKWKSDLNSSSNDDILSSSIFHKGKIAFFDKYPEEIKHALVLLGAFFGFRKFYDVYYDSLNLKFYKNFKSQIDKKDKRLKKMEIKKESSKKDNNKKISKRKQSDPSLPFEN